MRVELRIARLTVIQRTGSCKLQFLPLLLSLGLYYQPIFVEFRIYINDPTALQTFLWCRGGGKVGKRAVEQNYACVLSELTLQLGSCHGLANSGQHEPLRWGTSIITCMLASAFVLHVKYAFTFTVFHLWIAISNLNVKDNKM